MTTAYDQIVSDVSVATARPELVATGDIPLAIRRATLKLHSMAFWPRDLAEGIVTFEDTTRRTQIIHTPEQMLRFRAIKYIREFAVGASQSTQDSAQFFNKQEPDAILDDYGVINDNIWYLGGSNINLRGRQAIPSVAVGWYQHPPVATGASYESWIADTYPFTIVDEASRMIFKSTGNAEMAKMYDDIMAEHRQYMIQNFIDGEAR